MSLGVILYGPPAAGKDTVTSALSAIDARYQLLRRLKCGPGVKDGYVDISDKDLRALHDGDDVIWENRQYGHVYVVSRSILASFPKHCVPVLHLGQGEGVAAVRAATTNATEWVAVSLHCRRAEAEERLARRGATDVSARLRVWADTPRLPHADLTIDTGALQPAESARAINALVRARGLSDYLSDNGPARR